MSPKPPTYTPAQVQAILDLPPSTLRRYATLFRNYLSATAQTGHRRAYTDQDIAVIDQVQSLIAKGVRVDDIPAQLEIFRSNTIDQLQEEQTTTALALPGLIKQIDKIRRSLETEIDQLQEERAADRQLINGLQDQVDQLRRELAARRPWWAKIIRRNKS